MMRYLILPDPRRDLHRPNTKAISVKEHTSLLGFSSVFGVVATVT
jgi:hypothetical protein